MKLRFKGRFLKDKTEEEQEEELLEMEEEARLKDLLGDSYRAPEKKKREFIYDPLVQDSSNIVAFNAYDKTHTCIRTELGEVFIVKGSCDEISSKWTELTGEEIFDI